MNQILNREKKANEIKQLLIDFDVNKDNLLLKKGIYVYGEPGTGKTAFVVNILKEMKYDVIKYDAGDIRNTSVIEDITKHNMSNKNILSLFKKQGQKIAIIMDEIDGMNNGDKGGINSLIKLIRPKKTKKQKLENVSINPIICIGNYRIDKKIKELMKVCNNIELSPIQPSQLSIILDNLMPTICPKMHDSLMTYVQGDLKKLNNMYHYYKNKLDLFVPEIIEHILQLKSYNNDTKKITGQLLNQYYPMQDHGSVMNETDRTSIGLLWHENIIDVLEKMDKSVSVPFYISQLDNICFSDYIDRITFQKQIWQFNEMSSLIKTFKNNKLYHTTFPHNVARSQPEIRFTKALTKYSTEFNNSQFIQKLCQKLGMDKKDLFSFFIGLFHEYDTNAIMNLLDNYDIDKLAINRIRRYIEKYTKENASGTADKDIEEEDEENEEEPEEV